MSGSRTDLLTPAEHMAWLRTQMNDIVDILVDAAGERRFRAPRQATRNTHGTGCTLSAAVAAGLALGRSLDEAVAAAKAYLTDALAAADGLRIGSGAGPVHHFHAWWPAEAGTRP